MFEDLPWLIPTFVFLISFIIIAIIIAEVSWRNKIKEIKEEFNLIEGWFYNVTQNGGRTLKNLQFVKIVAGNRSKNGYINLIFIQNSKYRNGYTQHEIVVKYGSIWKVEKIS